MTMIKINKPVMQQVEVSREEVIRDIMGTVKNAKFNFGDLVYVNDDRNYYGNGTVENALGVVTHVAKAPYHPMTGECWEKDVKKEDRLGYNVAYKDANGRRTSISATAENLTAI